MRKEFSDTIEKLGIDNKKVVFISGDLGFNAFENLQDKLGDRFINAGVAEQSMVGIAAGLAKKGYKVFCYSIAPFIVYRCLEQIRNDVCFHNLPVFLVGNGGGFGYGVMGSSHHAISDIAAISSLQNITCWVPSFKNDVSTITKKILNQNKPAYLRLGRSTSEEKCSNFDSSLTIIENTNSKITLIALGSIVENVISLRKSNPEIEKINIISCNKLPLDINKESIGLLKASKKILIAEDHVEIGGLAQQISSFMHKENIKIDNFISLCAKNYPNDLYGSQEYHHKESMIDMEGIKHALLKLLKD
tara:strand:+ start:9813 stop:10724 length:912 start_codon:yes stop_codon:yes gene_type:complete